MITNNGEDWQPADEDVIEWQRAYQDIDVFNEMAAMSCWLDANPGRRKTKRGMKRFVNSWLQRANKAGGSPQHLQAPTGGVMPLKQWTAVDMLTHNFIDSPVLAQKWLEEHGQYVDSQGVRHYE